MQRNVTFKSNGLKVAGHLYAFGAPYIDAVEEATHLSSLMPSFRRRERDVRSATATDGMANSDALKPGLQVRIIVAVSAAPVWSPLVEALNERIVRAFHRCSLVQRAPGERMGLASGYRLAQARRSKRGFLHEPPGDCSGLQEQRMGSFRP